MIIPQPNTNLIINADSLTALKEMPENSVDSVVTDPPYGLSFMGKKWDYDVPSVELWKEVFRVMKPGAFLLSFAGTRTYHRMAVNIEDAGFEIRDMISWLYGSGFPKSLNIGKSIDKLKGNKREVIGANPNYRINNGQNNFQENATFNTTEGMKVKTKGTSQWEGWGTALKPAVEPIVVARKPLSEKNVALNVLKWGTGGINIDACRVGSEQIKTQGGDKFKGDLIYGKYNECKESFHQGRFPANLILDEEAGRLLDEQSGISKSSKQSMGRGFDDSEVFGTGDLNYNSERGHNDKGGASRFFYCAKSSKRERNNFGEVLFELKKDTPKEIKVEIEKYLNTD